MEIMWDILILMNLQSPEEIQPAIVTTPEIGENVIVNGEVEKEQEEVVGEPIQETIVETVQETIPEVVQEAPVSQDNVQPGQSILAKSPVKTVVEEPKVVTAPTTTTTTSTIPTSTAASAVVETKAAVVPEVKTNEETTTSKGATNDSSFILTPDYIQQSEFQIEESMFLKF